MTMDILMGLAIVNNEQTVEHLSIPHLPFDSMERLKLLFGKKSRWLVDELKLFMEPAVVSVDKFLLKYTKSFTVDGQRVCTFSKSLAY